LYVNEQSSSVAIIDASYSYWGTVDELNLTRAMFDGKDDIEKTTIHYIPYLLTDDPDGEKSSNESSLGFLRFGSILSGVLAEGEMRKFSFFITDSSSRLLPSDFY
jgi:hypothetical protein